MQPYTRKCSHEKCEEWNVKGALCVKHWILTRADKATEYKQKYSHHKLYRSVKWTKLRMKHLSDNPLCVECGVPAVEVDHIIDHKGNLELFYDINNLQTLCKSCHSRKSMTTTNIKRFRSVADEITIIMSKTKSDFDNISQMMGNNVSTEYLSKLIVKGSMKTTFTVKSQFESKLIQKSYKLKNKVNPIFKTIHEV